MSPCYTVHWTTTEASRYREFAFRDDAIETYQVLLKADAWTPAITPPSLPAPSRLLSIMITVDDGPRGESGTIMQWEREQK